MTSSNTSKLLLGEIPDTLKDELLSAYINIEKNFRERRWEPSELNGGKFSEVVYTIVKGYLSGSYPKKASKPPNMLKACLDLEKEVNSSRSLRIQIPRMIIPLYEIRNNRNVGHAGGDVDPNEMDAVCVLQMSKWILAELIRVFHKVTINEAQAHVNALSERELSLVWEVDDKLRILNSEMSQSDQSLCILYSKPNGLSISALADCIEVTNKSDFKRRVIKNLHKKRMIEFNENSEIIKISPTGARHVESKIINQDSKI